MCEAKRGDDDGAGKDYEELRSYNLAPLLTPPHYGKVQIPAGIARNRSHTARRRQQGSNAQQVLASARREVC